MTIFNEDGFYFNYICGLLVSNAMAAGFRQKDAKLDVLHQDNHFHQRENEGRCILTPSTPSPTGRQVMTEQKNILVIRFGALGDLCVMGWALARLKDHPDYCNHRVTLVTKAAFAPLMIESRGIDRVIPFSGRGLLSLNKLANQLRCQSWDVVLDMHNILRGNLLLAMLGQQAHGKLGKDTLARLTLLRTGRKDGSLKRTMDQRFQQVIEKIFPGSQADGVAPHLSSLAPPARDGVPILGISPGAQWATKRWPAGHVISLLRLNHQQSLHPVRIFLGPQEEKWFPGSELAGVASRFPEVEIIRQQSLTEIAAQLAGCSVLLTNDSGLLHISEAVGTPVLALFGPTVREFGYYPLLEASATLEENLECRPCSRNGKRPCKRKDLACLEQISAGRVLSQLEIMLKGNHGIHHTR